MRTSDLGALGRSSALSSRRGSRSSWTPPSLLSPSPATRCSAARSRAATCRAGARASTGTKKLTYLTEGSPTLASCLEGTAGRSGQRLLRSLVEGRPVRGGQRLPLPAERARGARQGLRGRLHGLVHARVPAAHALSRLWRPGGRARRSLSSAPLRAPRSLAPRARSRGSSARSSIAPARSLPCARALSRGAHEAAPSFGGTSAAPARARAPPRGGRGSPPVGRRRPRTRAGGSSRRAGEARTSC